VFARGPDGWITCSWKYLDKVPAPFGELARDHVSGRLAARGQDNPTELERALAVNDLLRRAYHGPPDAGDEAPAPARKYRRSGRQGTARDRRVAARTRAGTAARAGTGAPEAPVPAMTGDDPQAAEQDSGEPLAKVMPLGIFDPFEEAKKPW
jgi:putative transposase